MSFYATGGIWLSPSRPHAYELSDVIALLGFGQ